MQWCFVIHHILSKFIVIMDKHDMQLSTDTAAVQWVGNRFMIDPAVNTKISKIPNSHNFMILWCYWYIVV